MKTTPVEIRYHTEVSKEEMLAILENDERIETASGKLNLFGKLFVIPGVSDIEYDGHFGPFVWYSIMVEHDTKATHKAIERAIRSAIGK